MNALRRELVTVRRAAFVPTRLITVRTVRRIRLYAEVRLS